MLSLASRLSSPRRVLLRYPLSRKGNAAFFASSLGSHITTLLTTPAQRLHVSYLPVYTPNAEEEADAELYASQVRAAMGEASGLPLSEYGARELRREMKEKASQAKGKGA